MSKINKLIERFKSRPTDFTWDELVKILINLGFEELQGNGSRVKFYNKKNNILIQLHKPHPSKILKLYMIKDILDSLTQGHIL